MPVMVTLHLILLWIKECVDSIAMDL
jgi:hypothetical protein